MIDLLEELRRDAPGIPNRHDARAAALQQAIDPAHVLAALAEVAPSSAVVSALPEAAESALDGDTSSPSGSSIKG